MPSIRLIIGLANPGEDYEKTRHNAGAWFIQALAASLSVDFKREARLKNYVAKIMTPGPCYLSLPTTYMNLSGQAIHAIMQYYKIQAHEIMVAHDDIDLDVGTIKLKENGGHGGHNGLRDIFKQLNTQDFWRLRIGVGRPLHSHQVVDYVLKKPNSADKQQIDDCIASAIQATPYIFAGDFQAAMRQLHSE
jgi:peptidyl-tRNA hydrolase, PTH1 family